MSGIYGLVGEAAAPEPGRFADRRGKGCKKGKKSKTPPAFGAPCRVSHSFAGAGALLRASNLAISAGEVRMAASMRTSTSSEQTETATKAGM